MTSRTLTQSMTMTRHLAARPIGELQLCERCGFILMHNPKLLGKAHWFDTGSNVLANDKCAWQEVEIETEYDECIVDVN